MSDARSAISGQNTDALASQSARPSFRIDLANLPERSRGHRRPIGDLESLPNPIRAGTERIPDRKRLRVAPNLDSSVVVGRRLDVSWRRLQIAGHSLVSPGRRSCGSEQTSNPPRGVRCTPPLGSILSSSTRDGASVVPPRRPPFDGFFLEGASSEGPPARSPNPFIRHDFELGEHRIQQRSPARDRPQSRVHVPLP